MPGEVALADQLQLEALEKIAERCLKSAFEFGLALLEIKVRKLYRVRGYTRWQDYVDDVWQPKTGPRRVRQQIAAAKVVTRIAEAGLPVLLTNERQARSLAGLSPEKQLEVYQKSIEEDRLNAAKLAQEAREALARLTPQEQVQVVQEEEEDIEREVNQEEEHEQKRNRGSENRVKCPNCRGKGWVKA